MSRAYGPHDPAQVRTVKVLGPGKYPETREVPLPRPLEQQRRAINNRAWEAGT